MLGLVTSVERTFIASEAPAGGIPGLFEGVVGCRYPRKTAADLKPITFDEWQDCNALQPRLQKTQNAHHNRDRRQAIRCWSVLSSSIA